MLELNSERARGHFDEWICVFNAESSSMDVYQIIMKSINVNKNDRGDCRCKGY
jgi:hypothetical protein